MGSRVFRFGVAVFFFLAATLTASAQEWPSWKVGDVSATGAGRNLSVRMTLSLDGPAVPADGAVVLYPSVRGGDVSYSLKPVVFYGRKTAKRSDRIKASGDPDERRVSVLTGSLSYTMSDFIPYAPWLDDAKVFVEMAVWRKKKGLERGTAEEACRLKKPAAPAYPSFPWKGRTPMYFHTDSRLVELFFPLSFGGQGMAFDPDLGNNDAVLEEIVERITPYTGTRRFSVRKAEMVCVVPPAGRSAASLKRSKDLAKGIAAQLRRRGAFRMLSPTVTGGGENWAGALKWIGASVFAGDFPFETLFSGTPDDAGFRRMAENRPEEFRVLERDCFPGTAGVIFRFTVRTPSYLSGEALSRAAAESPEILSAKDWFTYASSFPVGSARWTEAVCEGSDRYPGDPALAYDAAMGLLALGSYDQSVSYVRRIPQGDDFTYAHSLLLLGKGRYGEARPWLDLLATKDPGYLQFFADLEKVFEWSDNKVDWEILMPE